jgi:membrane protein required for colicin V production
MTLSWVDLWIIGIMGVSGLVGLWRGLVREVLSLASWGLAIWVAIAFSDTLEGYLQNAIPSPTMRIAAAFGTLFLLTLMAASLVGLVLTQLLDTTGLTGIDRMTGLLFGLARGVLIVAVLVFLARSTPMPRDRWWRESHLIPIFQSIALWLEQQLPPGFIPRPDSKSISH